MIKVIFFDLSDTLCDYAAAAAAALDSACEYTVNHTDAVTAGGLREAYLRELQHAEAEADRWSASRLREGEVEVAHRLWERALENCGVVNPILAQAVACHYELARMRALQLLPDALPTLHALRERVRVGVVAEGRAGIVKEELTLLGLRQLVSAVIIEGEVGYSKRDPQLFLHAVREAGCEPAQAAHVGDSLAGDVAPAHQAGLVTVWVNRADESPQADLPTPDHTVPDLLAVPQLLLGEA
jgi:putative hydrolase of the HAD superfamily